MHVCRNYQQFPARFQGGVVAIGNFDGVHRGHQAILHRATTLAKENNLACVAMTFTPHPRSFFSTSGEVLAIDPLAIRLRRLKAEGVQAVLLQRFDTAFAALDAQTFVHQVLQTGLNAQRVVVGEDFCFGARRSGDVAFMREMFASHGVQVHALPPVMHDGRPVSSSRVRDAMQAGDMELAQALLGRPYQCYGRVRHGHKRGRTLHVPTANLALDHITQPKYGVYAVEYAIVESANCAKHPPHWQPGIANIGVRPSFDDGQTPTLEVHAFEPMGDVYGRYMRVRLLRYIREEVAFDSSDALQRQIQRDIGEVKAFFARSA